MGFVKKILSFGLLGQALGFGDEEEETAVAETVTTETDDTKSADEIEQERRNAIVAANAGAQKQTSPLQTSKENTTKKTLLGL